MINKFKYAMLALPLALAVSACGDQAAENEGQVQEATVDQPGFEDRSATPAEAQSEAMTLAEHLASGDLNSAEAADALEDLDRLVTANIVDFPQDIRPGLTEDVEAARSALESQDMEGLQEAATRIQAKLSSAGSATDAG